MENGHGNLTSELKGRVAQALELPADMLGDVPVVTVTGAGDVKVESYRGIIEYTDSVIRLNTAAHMVKISGKNLELKTIATEFIHVRGVIASVEFIV